MVPQPRERYLFVQPLTLHQQALLPFDRLSRTERLRQPEHVVLHPLKLVAACNRRPVRRQQIDPEEFAEVARLAGEMQGLGDYREMYGRFSVLVEQL